MSAPESSNSKAPPSLLSDKAKGADGNGSRILANLEGRVEPPAEKPRRSKTPLALVALLVIAAGGWGAWHMQQRVHTGTVASATPGDAAKVAVPAAATPSAPAASGAGQVAAKASAPAAASSQAATIIADDNDNDSKAAAPSASASAGNDGSRLSRALADGAEPSNASAPVAVVSVASAVSVPAAKRGKSATAVASNTKRDSRETREAATHGKKESVSARHASTPTAVAQTKKPRSANDSAKASKDDSDADLLAALVARTKPADAKTPAGNEPTRVSASAPQGNAKLAERVKECGQRGFFEDQLCRWRVCDGHWGKDPACPGSAQQARQP
ncbi:hypothetical protein PQQ51_10060 [Paraburkholderia xenovorans]|uniref:hypothetical protein n=1 Tax=Paraburkholderia xenovorans TaxID=36873 RepID=UPI0038BA7846